MARTVGSWSVDFSPSHWICPGGTRAANGSVKRTPSSFCVGLTWYVADLDHDPLSGSVRVVHVGVDSIAYHSQVLEGLPWTKESRASFILINASVSGERLGRDSLRCALKVVRACKYESTFVWVHLTKHALRHRVETNPWFLICTSVEPSACPSLFPSLFTQN